MDTGNNDTDHIFYDRSQQTRALINWGINRFTDVFENNKPTQVWKSEQNLALEQYLPQIKPMSYEELEASEVELQEQSKVESARFLPKRLIDPELKDNSVPYRIYFVDYSDTQWPNKVMGIEQFLLLPAVRALVLADIFVYPRDADAMRAVDETNELLKHFAWYTPPRFVERHDLENEIKRFGENGEKVALTRIIPSGKADEPDEKWIDGLEGKYPDTVIKPHNQNDFVLASNKALWAAMYNKLIAGGESVEALNTRFKEEFGDVAGLTDVEIERAINLAKIMMPESRVAQCEPQLLIEQLDNLCEEWLNDKEKKDNDSIIAFLKISNTASGSGCVKLTVGDLNELKMSYETKNPALTVVDLLIKKLPDMGSKKPNRLEILGSLIPILRGAELERPYNGVNSEGVDEASANYTQTEKGLKLLITTENITDGVVHDGNGVNMGGKHLKGTIVEGKHEDFENALTYLNYMFLAQNKMLAGENWYGCMLKDHPQMIGGFDFRFKEVSGADGKKYLIPVLTDPNCYRPTGNTAAHACAMTVSGRSEATSEKYQKKLNVETFIIDKLSYTSFRASFGKNFGDSYNDLDDNQRSACIKQISELMQQNITVKVDEQEYIINLSGFVFVFGFADVKNKYGLNIQVPQVFINQQRVDDQIITQVRELIVDFQVLVEGV